MSTISELNKLIDAGFTKDDILKFYNAKAGDSANGNNPVSNGNNDPDKNTNDKDGNSDDKFDSLTSQIGELIKTIQSSNIIKDTQPKARTIDDIFESMFKDEEDE